MCHWNFIDYDGFVIRLSTPNCTLIINLHSRSLETRITASVKELGELLQKVGGGGAPGQPQPPAHHEADEVLRPLMDILVS